jgi:hypothetical protein
MKPNFINRRLLILASSLLLTLVIAASLMYGSSLAAGITVTPTSGLITTENGETATFTIVLDTQPATDVTIGLTSDDLTEGTVSPASVTFTVDDWDTPQEVTVTGVEDAIVDGPIVYNIVTASAVSEDIDYSGMNAANVSVTNTDNDPGIIVSPTSGLTTTEAGGTATFTIMLSTLPSDNVTIDLSSSNTAEGTVSPASVTFTSANGVTPQTVTVTGVDDFADDGDIVYSIVTAQASSADGLYAAINPDDVSVTNTDNDTAGITVNPISGPTTEAGGTATFTIVLTSEPLYDVTIGITSSNPAEGTVDPASVTFTAGDWDTAQEVTVTGVDDFGDDGDIVYSIVTAQATSDDPLYAVINPDDVSVTNIDDDTAGITVSPTSGLITSENGETASFTIVLDSQPIADATVTIGLSSSVPTEGTVLPIQVIFTEVNWNIAQQIQVTGVDDFIIDGDKPYTIITTPATSTDPLYSGMVVSDVSVTNQDDDIADLAMTPDPRTGGISTTEYGTPYQFTIALTSQPSANVNIALSSDNTDEATVSPDTLSFTSSNWNTPRTVTVTGVDDVYADGDQLFTITLVPSSTDPNFSLLESVDLLGTNSDNDTAGYTINPPPVLETSEGEASVTITIFINTKPFQPITLNFALTGGDTDEAKLSLSTTTITPDSWTPGMPIELTITGVDDLLDDGDRAYQVTISSQSSDPPYNELSEVLSMVNRDAPTIEWVLPVPTEGIYTIDNLAPILLRIRKETAEKIGISKVRFIRWDPIIKEHVTIGEDSEPPYQIYLNPSDLYFDYNQIFAYAYGPDSPVPGEYPVTSVQKWILILRWEDFYYRIFLPTIQKSQ